MPDWSTTIRLIIYPLFAAGIASVSSRLLVPEMPMVNAVSALAGAVVGLIATYLIERERTRREALRYRAGIIRAQGEYVIAKAQAAALTSAIEAATGGPRKTESAAKDVRADGLKVLKQLGDEHLQMARILHEPGPDTNSPAPATDNAPPTPAPTEPVGAAETPPGPRRLPTGEGKTAAS